jgi:hypothetical protein
MPIGLLGRFVWPPTGGREAVARRLQDRRIREEPEPALDRGKKEEGDEIADVTKQ